MQIIVYKDAVKRFLRTFPENAGLTREGIKYKNILSKIEGHILSVDINFLFDRSFNVPAVEGLLENPIGIRDYLVEKVIEDIRPLYVQCQYCRYTVKKVDYPAGSVCSICEKGYLKEFIIPKRLQGNCV